MRIFLFSALLFFSQHLVVAQTSYPLVSGQDIKHYAFHISISDSSDFIYGEATLTYTTSAPKLVLDLTSPTGTGKGMEVDSVKRAGEYLRIDHENHRLTIYLPAEGANAGTLTIYYQGMPANGLIIANNKFGKRVFFGDNYPDRARNWLPCVDHPADKASVTWSITAPQHYKVVASGLFVETKPAYPGYTTTIWDEKQPISTKVMVFGAANFAVAQSGMLRDIPVTTWVYEQNKEAGFKDFASAPAILAFYDSLIGPYPYEKLANVQSKTMYGGMENAGNIFYYENAVTGRAQIDDLIAHEIVHQWFGNSATEKDWAHAWLSEGFATYLTNVFIGTREGKDKMLAELAADREEVITYWHQNPLPVVNTSLVSYPQVTNLWTLLSTNTYKKGGWVLYMLNQELGDKVFWQGIRQYYATYRDSIAGTEELQKALEVVSGKDLTNFFQQWLYRDGHPQLVGDWSYSKKKGQINVYQKQVGLFVFPLELGLVYGDEMVIKTVQINAAHQTIEFTESQPDKIVFDPHTRLLFEGKEELVYTEPQTSATRLHDIWVLESLHGKALAGNKRPVMELHMNDNSVSGNGGCNNYRTGFRVKGKSIEFDKNMISTRMTCEQADLEQEYFTAMAGNKFKYKLENNHLILSAKGKPVLVFKKID